MAEKQLIYCDPHDVPVYTRHAADFPVTGKAFNYGVNFRSGVDNTIYQLQEERKDFL
jgi:hypothetical protein